MEENLVNAKGKWETLTLFPLVERKEDGQKSRYAGWNLGRAYEETEIASMAKNANSWQKRLRFAKLLEREERLILFCLAPSGQHVLMMPICQPDEPRPDPKSLQTGLLEAFKIEAESWPQLGIQEGDKDLYILTSRSANTLVLGPSCSPETEAEPKFLGKFKL